MCVPSQKQSQLGKSTRHLWTIGAVMRYATVLWSLLLLSSLKKAGSLNIVAVSTLATRSHFLWMDTLISELLARGHLITELTFKQPSPHPNRTSFVLENGLFSMDRYMVIINSTRTEHFLKRPFSFYDQAVMAIHRESMETKAFQKFKEHLLSKKEKIDLILIDYAQRDPLIGVSQLVGYPPIVAVTAYNRPAHLESVMGSPQVPSLTPHESSPFSCDMSFSERVQNFLAYLIHSLIEYFYFEPVTNELLKQRISPDSPSLAELEQNISIAMANTHPTTHCQVATSSSLIDVGFLHVKPPKPLPKEIQSFLDEAKHGAVVVSFGSTIQPDAIPGLQNIVLSVIRNSKQRFLWKTSNPPENLPPNVLVSKWFPQSDILAHPKVLLLLAHGGTLSMQEAVYRGVPILMIPFCLDQLSNANRVASLGIGRRLNYDDDLTYEALSHEVNEILSNRKYAEKIKLLSTIAQDQPESALQRAVFWLEYVGRHRGAPHLRIDIRRMSWIKYYSIDVIALLALSALLVTTIISLCICCIIRRMYHTKRKIKDQ